MAFEDIRSEDAGADYYAKRFGDRVRGIRKYGDALPRNARPATSGWKIAVGVLAVLVLVRILITLGLAVCEWDDSDRRQPFEPSSPATTEWNGGLIGEPRPWQMREPDPPDWQLNIPQLGPEDPQDPGPDPAPEDVHKRPGRDD